MFFGLKKFNVIILCSIVLISTGAGTYIQFIKGDLFQAAIDNKVNELFLLITLFLVSVVTELLFYYIEWKFENKLYSQFVNNTKKSISKSILSTNHFDNFDDTKNSAINILNNKIDRLEFQYYKSLFDNTYLFFKIILVSISLFYINILVAMVVLIFLFVPLVITKFFKEKMSNREKRYQDYKGNNLKLYENFFSNLKSIKIFDLRSVLQEKLENSIDKEVNQYKNLQNQI
jgi:ABC-type multidrug transport system fused ATPase/permease subunit